MSEGYKPTPEEIKSAEGMMSKEQEVSSSGRERLDKKSDEELIYSLQDAYSGRDISHLRDQGFSEDTIDKMMEWTALVKAELLRRLKKARE